MTAAPRIDFVRNEINHAIGLLRLLAGQLDDLHVLAYNRHKAAQEAKVRGGSRDYALDNHGDKQARDLYAQVANDLRSTINDLTGSIKDVRGYLTRGAGTIRRDPTADCTVDEVLAALDAQRKRRARGEYEPTPLVLQPEVHSQTEWQAECEALRSAVRKAVAAFVDDHQHCTHTVRLPRRPAMNLLTPRERDAWRRAQSVRVDETEKAS